MTKKKDDMHPPKQKALPGVLPPLTMVQEAALSYVEMKAANKRLKDKENDCKKTMVNAAAKAGVDVIKVHDSAGMLHVFDFSNDVRIKHTQTIDVKIEKFDPEGQAE